MNPIAWLIGLALPACGFPAAEGLPTPPIMDVTQIVRPNTPNTALAAPEGYKPAPEIATHVYKMTAEKLFALVQDVARSQFGVYQAALYPERLQVHYVVRSAVFNFPDLVMAQVRQVGPDASDLIIYSRSVYGHSDLNVNRKRIETWLAVLQTRIPLPNER